MTYESDYSLQITGLNLRTNLIKKGYKQIDYVKNSFKLAIRTYLLPEVLSIRSQRFPVLLKDVQQNHATTMNVKGIQVR